MNVAKFANAMPENKIKWKINTNGEVIQLKDKRIWNTNVVEIQT